MGRRFEDTDEFRGAEFVNVDLSGARFRNVDLTGAKVMEAMLVGARISGLIEGLVLNDVEVGPLIAPSSTAGTRSARSCDRTMPTASGRRGP